MAVLNIEAQTKPSISMFWTNLHVKKHGTCYRTIFNYTFEYKSLTLEISSKCLGNMMRVDVGPLGGKLLELAVVISILTFLTFFFLTISLFPVTVPFLFFLLR